MPEFNEFQVEKRKPLSPLRTFLLKAVIVVVAINCIVVFSTSYVRTQYEQATLGQNFWKSLEERLYRLADEDDVPPEKKARILGALQKLSVKYAPYLQALTPPDKKPNPL